MLEPSAAADQAAGQIVANAGPQNDWADQFSNMRHDNGNQPGGWAEEFAQVTHSQACKVSKMSRHAKDDRTPVSALILPSRITCTLLKGVGWKEAGVLKGLGSNSDYSSLWSGVPFLGGILCE